MNLSTPVVPQNRCITIREVKDLARRSLDKRWYPIARAEDFTTLIRTWRKAEGCPLQIQKGGECADGNWHGFWMATSRGNFRKAHYHAEKIVQLLEEILTW